MDLFDIVYLCNNNDQHSSRIGPPWSHSFDANVQFQTDIHRTKRTVENQLIVVY